MVKIDESEIRLRVPARAPYARVVRVGAAALALRVEMGFEEIDDLRLAIDEAMFLLMNDLDDPDANVDIDIVFRLEDGRFVFQATRMSDQTVSDTAARRFMDIAREIVDDYEISMTPGRVKLRKTPAGQLGE